MKNCKIQIHWFLTKQLQGFWDFPIYTQNVIKRLRESGEIIYNHYYRNDTGFGKSFLVTFQFFTVSNDRYYSIQHWATCQEHLETLQLLWFQTHRRRTHRSDIHIFDGTTSAERYIQVSKRHTWPSRWRLFQGCLCSFQQENAKLQRLCVATAGLCR